MLTIEADIYEYVRMSYVDKNILGPLVHIYKLSHYTHACVVRHVTTKTTTTSLYRHRVQPLRT